MDHQFNKESVNLLITPVKKVLIQHENETSLESFPFHLQ